MLQGIILHMQSEVRKMQHIVDLNEVHDRAHRYNRNRIRHQKALHLDGKPSHLVPMALVVVHKPVEIHRCAACNQLFKPVNTAIGPQLVCFECMTVMDEDPCCRWCDSEFQPEHEHQTVCAACQRTAIEDMQRDCEDGGSLSPAGYVG
jgi:hypothetical protein